jgi:hypothetical protein
LGGGISKTTCVSTAPKLNLWPFSLGKKVDGELIPSADAVRDLGAWFDKHMNMSIHVKKVCQSAYGDRSFSVGAARLWNELPQQCMPLEDNESFKRELKTWLF